MVIKIVTSTTDKVVTKKKMSAFINVSISYRDATVFKLLQKITIFYAKAQKPLAGFLCADHLSTLTSLGDLPLHHTNLDNLCQHELSTALN